jgi:hypothetical protein
MPEDSRCIAETHYQVPMLLQIFSPKKSKKAFLTHKRLDSAKCGS